MTERSPEQAELLEACVKTQAALKQAVEHLATPEEALNALRQGYVGHALAVAEAAIKKVRDRALYKERRTTRVVRGQVRRMVIRTFCAGPTQENYDTFLYGRPEGTTMRRGANFPTVEVDGYVGYASYEFEEPTA